MSDLAIRFLRWARTAPDELRAEGAGALAASLAVMPAQGRERAEAVAVLTHLLDDPSPLVRRALADELAEQPDAPLHILSALAGDVSDVAVAVLSRSVALGDAELLEVIAVGDDLARLAIALRDRLSPALVAALCDSGSPSTVVALCRNPGAVWGPATLATAASRHGADPEARDALLCRADLPVAARHTLRTALDASTRGPSAPGTDAALRAALSLSPELSDDERAELVRHLRRTGQMTAGLLLAAATMGDEPLLACAFAELAAINGADADAILRARAEAPRRALYARARLPESLRDAFVAAHAAARRALSDGALPTSAALGRIVLDAVLVKHAARPEPGTARAAALVRRMVDDLVRREARSIVAELERAVDELPPPAPLLIGHVAAEAADSAAHVEALDSFEGNDPELSPFELAPPAEPPTGGHEHAPLETPEDEWLVDGSIRHEAAEPALLSAPTPDNDESALDIAPPPRRAFGRRPNVTERHPLATESHESPWGSAESEPEPSVAERIRARVLARLQARQAA